MSNTTAMQFIHCDCRNIQLFKYPFIKPVIVIVTYFIAFRSKEIDISNLYNVTKPGDTTHDDIRLEFSNYFVKFNQKTRRVFVDSSYQTIQLVPCYILQVYEKINLLIVIISGYV